VTRTPAAVLDELEHACVEVEKALREQRWADCNQIWNRQRRLTHELEVSIRSLTVNSPEHQAALKRIARIAKYRDGQLKRLRAFHSAIAKRLATIERYRAFSKTVGERPRSRVLDATF
jgi:hypothetical protein